MSITLNVPENQGQSDLRPKITVIGVGGAGGNAVNNMIDSQLEGVEFVVANTDAQALEQSKADRRIQLGSAVTGGLGAGAKPQIGRAAAEESMEDIIAEIHGSNMIFIAAGMGGGTGTGAAPVVARAAREQGILTVGVVTKPFQFEGAHRANAADEGIKDLEQFVDTLIVIPNQNLFRVANEKTTFADAFKMADDVLYSGVRGVTDLIVMPGLINLDFADIRSVMSEMGKAMMGTGEAEGERRALEAAEAAICNPLLDDTSMKGARSVLINITGGPDMTLYEADEAANRIRSEVDGEAYIIFGSTFDPNLEGRMRVSVVSTGMDGRAIQRPEPKVLDVVSAVASAVEEAEAKEEQVEEPAPMPILSQQLSIDMPEQAAPAPQALDMAVAEGAEEDAPQEVAAEEETVDMGTAPVGTPSINTDDSFIPPAPAAQASREPVEAEPIQAAEAAPEATATARIEEEKTARSRALSLFEKVTGAARPKDTATVQPFRKPEPAPVAAAPKAETDTLLNVSQEDRPSVQSAETDDDMLDIPAFLRRQAN